MASWIYRRLKGEAAVFAIAVAAAAWFFVLIPELTAMATTPDGEVWVPVNSQYRMSSDAYFYAAAVQETREDFWHYSLPATAERGAFYSADALRVFTYRLLAVGGLFLPDMRVAYLVSFATFVVVNALLMYALARQLGLGAPGAAAVALTVLFWLRVPLFLDSVAFDPSAIGQLRQYLRGFLMGEVDFDGFNDNFRYAILQTAVCVLWAYLLILSRFDKRPSMGLAAALGVVGIALAYTYVGLALIAGLVTAAYASAALVRGEGRTLRYFGTVGLVALLASLAVGLPEHAGALLAGQGPTLGIYGWSGGADALNVLGTRSLTVALSLVFALALRRLRPGQLPRFAMASIFAGVVLLVGQMLGQAWADHFAVRGYPNLIVFAALTTGSALVTELIRRAPWDAARAQLRFAPVVLLLGAAVPAFVGNIALARTYTTSEALRIPAGQWAAYEYLREHAPANSEVLAYDWEDVQLLPVYTHVNLFFGDVSFTGRSQLEEIRRYVTAWRFADYPVQILRERLETAVETGQRYGYATPARTLERPVTEGPMLLRHLFYDPYVKAVDGLAIRDASGSRVNPALVDLVTALAAGASPGVISGATGPNILLLSTEYEMLRPTPFADFPGFRIVARNDSRTIYARLGGSLVGCGAAPTCDPPAARP